MDTATHGRVSHLRRIVFISLCAVVALIAAGFVPFIGGDYFWHRAWVAFELRGLYVAEGNSEPVAPFNVGIFGLSRYIVPGADGIVGDFAEAYGTRIAVMRDSGDQPPQVWELTPVKKQLSSGSGAKALVAVSPDGKLVAYSVVDTPKFAPSLSLWSIHLANLSTGTEFAVGRGAGPQFFSEGGKTFLLYTSLAGITVMDTDKLKSFTTPFDFSDNIGFIARVSPDGRYITLRDRATVSFSLYELYRIGSDVPLGIRPLPATVNGFDDVTLTARGAFGTSFSNGSVSISSIPYDATDAGSRVLTFSAEAPYRFIP